MVSHRVRNQIYEEAFQFILTSGITTWTDCVELNRGGFRVEARTMGIYVRALLKTPGTDPPIGPGSTRQSVI